MQAVGQSEPAVFGRQDCLLRSGGRNSRQPAGRLGRRAAAAGTPRRCQAADENHGRDATRTHHYLRPEYSSICVVRSSGYEILTSVIVPSLAFTGSSLGWTKPV